MRRREEGRFRRAIILAFRFCGYRWQGLFRTLPTCEAQAPGPTPPNVALHYGEFGRAGAPRQKRYRQRAALIFPYGRIDLKFRPKAPNLKIPQNVYPG